MKMPANSDFNTYGNVNDMGRTSFSSIKFEEELNFYGIREFDHYKKSPNGIPNIDEYRYGGSSVPPPEPRGIISWNENYNVN